MTSHNCKRNWASEYLGFLASVVESSKVEEGWECLCVSQATILPGTAWPLLSLGGKERNHQGEGVGKNNT